MSILLEEFAVHVVKRVGMGSDVAVDTMEQTVTLRGAETFQVDMVHVDSGDDADYLLPDHVCECVSQAVLTSRSFAFLSFAPQPALFDEMLDACLRELFDAIDEVQLPAPLLALHDLPPSHSWRVVLPATRASSLREARRLLAPAQRSREPHAALVASFPSLPLRIILATSPFDGRAPAALTRALLPLQSRRRSSLLPPGPSSSRFSYSAASSWISGSRKPPDWRLHRLA